MRSLFFVRRDLYGHLHGGSNSNLIVRYTILKTQGIEPRRRGGLYCIKNNYDIDI